MRKKKTVLLTAGAVALTVAGLFAGSVLAYMMDSEDNINTFSVGDIEIVASEPSWPTEDTDGNGVPDESELLTPYEEVDKDPRITNTGINDAVVFFRMYVPAEELTLIGDDGSRSDPTLSDLVWFKQDGDSADLHENHFDENWTLISQEVIEKGIDGTNDEGAAVCYVFGYNTRLARGDSTTNLFDKIQNKKYGSATIAGKEVETILIDGFGIQADNLWKEDGTYLSTDGTISKDDLTYIYNLFFNQNRGRLEGGHV